MPSPPPDPGAPPTRVLLVEDDERIRLALGLALGDLGFEVRDAASGELALERLGEPLELLRRNADPGGQLLDIAEIAEQLLEHVGHAIAPFTQTMRRA